MTLRELKIGKSARIIAVGGEGALRQHFLDMGVIPGAEITLEKYAPMGDPMELSIHGYELTLRLADAEHIEVEEMVKDTGDSIETAYGAGKSKGNQGEENGRFSGQRARKSKLEHPGLGEGGKYHQRRGGYAGK